MLKLLHETTPDAVGDPEGLTIDLDEICRVAAQDMLAVSLAGRAPGLLGGQRLRARRHWQAPGGGKRVCPAPGGDDRGGDGRGERAPRVDDRRDGERFGSAILPAYMRKSPKVTEVLPILYLRGLSTGDFAPALGEFFGSEAGLSPSTVNRLTEAWQVEHEEWSERDLSGVDYVYWWVDGIHFNIRLEEDRLCCLVIVGVRPDGTKELVALADGYRESTESLGRGAALVADRGLAAPVLAVGDGALGFWGALREVFPSTREQRCWVHVTANVSTRCPNDFTPMPRTLWLRSTGPSRAPLRSRR